MMSGWSAPLAEPSRGDESRFAVRRRTLRLVGHALLAATVFPALRLRAEAVTAANTVKTPFDAGSLKEVLRLLDAHPIPSDDISLAVPDFVENGARVPVEITSRLSGSQQIFVISESNPFPLVARFSVPDGTAAFVATRIKVASSCNVHALVQSEGRFFSAVKATTVAVGGCGA